MYLTFDEYEEYGGTLEDETAFEDFEYEARAFINHLTFNRLKNEISLSESVKRCMFKLIEMAQTKKQTMLIGQTQTDDSALPAIKSQSNDGVSISYNVMDAQTLFSELQSELPNICKRYLEDETNSEGKRILYRGLYPDEY